MAQRTDPLTEAVESAMTGDDHVIYRNGLPVAVLVGVQRYEKMRSSLVARRSRCYHGAGAVSRELGWTERHKLTPDDLRRLADTLDEMQRTQPLLGMVWSVDVVASMLTWTAFDAGIAPLGAIDGEATT